MMAAMDRQDAVVGRDYSTDGGATWTTEATRALMFSTFSNPLPQAGGGRRL